MLVKGIKTDRHKNEICTNERIHQATFLRPSQYYLRQVIRLLTPLMENLPTERDVCYYFLFRGLGDRPLSRFGTCQRYVFSLTPFRLRSLAKSRSRNIQELFR